ncbi:MAG: nuclease [Betaproteobacteria bacterium]|nr:nuclease [Betaproteobacteria bacterium]
MNQPYTYKAIVTRVVDGDTVIADIDLGMDLWRKNVRLRLAGINAPEAETPQGEAAARGLREMFEQGRDQVLISTQKDRSDKYGRLLATIFLFGGTSVNQRMVELGHAVKM